MKLLYGTGNPAKLEAMRRRLAGLNLEILGLADMEGGIPQAPEDGTTPLENAGQKALAYYKYYKMPVFSCDSGLYFDNVCEEDQPGVHVRTVGGRYLTDQEMLEYYGGHLRCLCRRRGEIWHEGEHSGGRQHRRIPEGGRRHAVAGDLRSARI